MNYAVFDKFLSIDTWHTMHDYDLQRFYTCLKGVVADPNFDPEAMGAYFSASKGASFQDAIHSLVEKAWALKDFLRMTNSRLI